MDMWKPCANSVRSHLGSADDKGVVSDDTVLVVSEIASNAVCHTAAVSR